MSTTTEAAGTTTANEAAKLRNRLEDLRKESAAVEAQRKETTDHWACQGLLDKEEALTEEIIETAKTLAGLEHGPRDDVPEDAIADDADGAEVVSMSGREVQRDDLPDVLVGGQLRDVAAGAAKVLVDGNRPSVSVFRRAGRLCRFQVTDERTGEEGLEEYTQASLSLALSRRANWYARDGKRLKDTNPPALVVTALLDEAPEAIPYVRRVARAPYLRADGTLVCRKGFHPEDGVYLAEDHSLMIAPPKNPTDEDVDRAVRFVVDDLLGDFRFATPADRAHYVAALVEQFVPELIGDAPNPMHLIEAAKPGSGKSLLGKVLGVIVMAHEPAGIPWAKEQSEQEKTVLAELMRCEPIFFLDNVKGRIDLAILEAALTGSVAGRVLGRSEMTGTLFTYGKTWLATLNHAEVSEDMARRIVRTLITEGKGPFRHDPLLTWVRQNRSRLHTAILTLVAHWLATGARPFTKRKLVTYERWGEVVGGILETAGIEGVLDDSEARKQLRSLGSQEWDRFAHDWRKMFGYRWVTAGDVLDGLVAPITEFEVKNADGKVVRVDRTSPKEVSYLVQDMDDAKSRPKRLGWLLKSRADNEFDGLVLRRYLNKSTKQWEYRFEDVNPANEPAEPAAPAEAGDFT